MWLGFNWIQNLKAKLGSDANCLNSTDSELMNSLFNYYGCSYNNVCTSQINKAMFDSLKFNALEPISNRNSFSRKWNTLSILVGIRKC